MNDLNKLEKEYIELFKDVFMPFPLYWFDSKNVELKKKVLKQAIEEKKLIDNITDAFVEGVF